MNKKLKLFFLFHLPFLSLNLANAQNPGDLDLSFNNNQTGTNSGIMSMAQQTDGKIIISGTFTSYNGVTKNRIARLNPDGSIDNSFNIGTGFNTYVNEVALQADGKVIVTGTFTSYNGVSKNHIIRLNTDGSIDNSFNVGTGTDLHPSPICIQPDGKILIGGQFTTYNGITRNRIARLNTDGTLDTSFDPAGGANSTVSAIKLQPDGKILLGGAFYQYDGITRNYFARLNVNGSLDTTLNTGSQLNDYVSDISIQPNGKILICGNFTKRIKRLNTDGTADASFFAATGANAGISNMLLQTDGRILICGGFSSYNGTARKKIARLHTNGTLDTSFNPGMVYINNVSVIYAMVLQADEKLVIGGIFNQYNGTMHDGIVRLYNCIGVQHTDTHTACGSYTWIDGNTYNYSTNSAIYPIAGGSSTGCDSIVVLNLTINPLLSSTQNVEICTGESVTVGSNTYTNAGTYTDTFTSVSTGCDSVVNTILTVNPLLSSTQTLTICNGESVTIGSSIYTNSGTYSDILTSAVTGCDSTVTTILTVNNPTLNTQVNESGITLSAVETQATYQWIDCTNGNTPVSGATSQTFTAGQNGDYAVILTSTSCPNVTATSNCIAIESVGLDEITKNKLTLYPNPVIGQLFVSSENNIQSIELKDLSGKVILRKTNIGTINTSIEMSELSNGSYLLEVSDDSGKYIERILKEK